MINDAGWIQVYSPVGGSIGLSALTALLPLLVLAYTLLALKKPSYIAALFALLTAFAIALFIYGAPFSIVLSSALMGAAFGLFPIMWIVLNALFIYNITVETGRFSIIRDSISAVSGDRRIQALLVAFSFGALMESIAGFGTPVALAGAMLVGLGFAPEVALLLVLMSNTASVAFGNLGTPVVSLAGVIAPYLGNSRESIETALASSIGRQITPLAVLVPFLLILVLSGWRGVRAVWPAALACGASFGLSQLIAATLIGPVLAGLLASIISFGAVILLLRFWQPKPEEEDGKGGGPGMSKPMPAFMKLIDAWSPFLILIGVVIVGSLPFVSANLNLVTAKINWPFLDGLVYKSLPLVTPEAAGTSKAVYAAVFTFDWLRSAGTLTIFSAILSLIYFQVSLKKAISLYFKTIYGLRKPFGAVTGFLALAWVMNYAGLTGTLGLFLTFTGAAFPFFSAIIGWLGVFLTGSDTSSNNLFGGLQVTAAREVGTSPLLAATTNSSGGVCGKLISPQNIAIGTASVGLPGAEGQILRKALPWSFGMAAFVGVISLFQAYVWPGSVPPIG